MIKKNLSLVESEIAVFRITNRKATLQIRKKSTISLSTHDPKE